MKFLIIDDNAIERSLTIQALAGKFVDVDMIEIGSPEIFNDIMVQAHFDVVITEFRLAWTDGLSLFKEIHERHAGIPVIMLTDSGNETVAVTAIKNGMADYLVKSNRHLLADAVEQSLFNSVKRTPYNDKNNLQSRAKWDSDISRLATDFIHAMRLLPSNKPVFEWVTEALKRMINHRDVESLEQLQGVLLITQPDNTEIIESRLKQLLEGFDNTVAYRIIGNDEHCRYASDHGLPTSEWANANVVYIYGPIQELTKQRKIEDQLRLMQCAIDSSNVGILITGLADTDHAIVYANDAFLRLTGYSLDEVLGHNCRILQKNDGDQSELEGLRTALNENRDSHTILRNYRKDGSLFWNEIHISPVRNEHNKITHYVGVQSDVTERCEMQVLLSKNEAKLRAIFNSVLDGIIIIDECGLIETLNPSAEKIFGYQKEELIGQHINGLIHGADQSRHMSFSTSDDETIIGIGREVFGLRKDGSTFSMELGINKINADDCHLLIGTVHDVSNHKQAEDALRKLSRHLELAREDERARIAREIHDELGSVLTALKMDLSWLSKQLSAAQPSYYEQTEAITRHIDNAIQVVRKIMTDLRPDILDHFGLLAAIDWYMEKFRQQTDMECILTVPESAIEIDAKRSTAVFRIIQEALNNIVLHAMATRVTIEISVIEEGVKISV